MKENMKENIQREINKETNHIENQKIGQFKSNFYIQCPDPVTQIIKIIEQAGFEAYAVGGCVRDSILSREPDDWDITTNAKPEEVKALFSHTIDTGIKHGTITIMIHKEGYEVTTYRIDGEYEDSRHPKEVSFTTNLAEDLKRRDFTINAMAYNENVGIVDLFEGMEDLNKKTIRAVGNPMERFGEDALRMMRAIRFCAQLGYEMEPETRNAIIELHQTLQNISAERIQVELIKLLCSDHPDKMELLYDTKLTSVFFKEFDIIMETNQNHPHHQYSVGVHTLKGMEHVRNDKIVRLTMLLHDIGKPKALTIDEDGINHFYGHALYSKEIAKDFLKRLRFDNDTITKVTTLVYYHDYKMDGKKRSIRRAMNKIGKELFPLLLEVQEADILAQSMYMREEKLADLKKTRQLYEEILALNECVSLKDLAVTGNDLLEIGVKPGKGIGEMLKELLELVIEDETLNKKEQLLELAKQKNSNKNLT